MTLEDTLKLMKLYGVSFYKDQSITIRMNGDLTKKPLTLSKVEKMQQGMPSPEELLYGSTTSPNPFIGMTDLDPRIRPKNKKVADGS